MLFLVLGPAAFERPLRDPLVHDVLHEGQGPHVGQLQDFLDVGLDDALRLCWLSGRGGLPEMQVVDELDPPFEACDVAEEEAPVALQDEYQDETEVLVVALRLQLVGLAARDLELDLREPVITDVDEKVGVQVRHLAVEEVQDALPL